MSTFRIVHPIAHIRQPRPGDCWAAAAAMARGRVNGDHMLIWDVQQLASREGVRVNPDGTLPLNDLPNTRRLATAMGLHVHDVRSATVTLEMVRGHLRLGRLAILGGFDYPDRPSVFMHAVTFYRMWGDGTPLGTTISLVDPHNGRADNFDWDWFDNDIMADPHFILHH